jgi:hypothetical protein
MATWIWTALRISISILEVVLNKVYKEKTDIDKTLGAMLQY